MATVRQPYVVGGSRAHRTMEWVRRHSIPTYYALTFAISWGLILMIVSPGQFLNTTSTSPAFVVVGPASILGPALAGLILTGLIDGKPGFRRLLDRLRRWRVGVRWYAVALLTAPLVSLTILFAFWLTSPAFAPDIITTANKASLLLAAIASGLLVPAFEELGWTGFAMPTLRLRYSIVVTGLIMGVLWGAWHLPLFAGSAAASGNIPPTLFVAVMLFWWLVPYRVLMVWVYDRTQSLLLAMLMHMPIVVGALVLNVGATSGDQKFASLIASGAAYWLIVAGVVLANQGRLTRKPARVGFGITRAPGPV